MTRPALGQSKGPSGAIDHAAGAPIPQTRRTSNEELRKIKLADQIIESQREEITEMKRLIEELERQR